MEFPDDDLDPETFFASVREREELDVEKYIEACQMLAGGLDEEMQAVRDGLIDAPSAGTIERVRAGRGLIGILASARVFLLEARDTEIFAERYDTGGDQFGGRLDLASEYARAGEVGLRCASRMAAAEREMRVRGWLADDEPPTR